MEKKSTHLLEKELPLERNRRILAEEAKRISSFYNIPEHIEERVAILPIDEMDRDQAVRRIEEQEDIQLPKSLPEEKLFDDFAEILGTSREEIINRRKRNKGRELENTFGYYYQGRGQPEIILIEDGIFTTEHTIRHEIIHAIRGEIEPDEEKLDEKEGVVESLELFSRPGKEPKSPRDFLKLRQEIISGEIEVGFPEDVNRFIIALGATYVGNNPLTVKEAAEIHFQEGDTLLSIKISSKVPENIRKNVNDILLKLK